MTSEGVPGPDHAGRFRAGDGIELFEQAWYPPHGIRAGLILLHGICEHSGRYRQTAGYLAERGYAVETFDLRGHGRSGGERCLVESFQEYLGDLDVFLGRVHDRLPDKPVFLLGQGMGGTISLYHIITRRSRLRGLLLSAPFLAGKKGAMRLRNRMNAVLSRIVPNWPAFKLDADAFSRDPGVIEQRDEDPYVFQGRVPVRTGIELQRAGQHILNRAQEITLPLLVMHGSRDRLASPGSSRSLFENAHSGDKSCKLYEELFHEILQEPEKETVWRDIENWLAAHIRSGDR